MVIFLYPYTNDINMMGMYFKIDIAQTIQITLGTQHGWHVTKQRRFFTFTVNNSSIVTNIRDSYWLDLILTPINLPAFLTQLETTSFLPFYFLYLISPHILLYIHSLIVVFFMLCKFFHPPVFPIIFFILSFLMHQERLSCAMLLFLDAAWDNTRHQSRHGWQPSSVLSVWQQQYGGLSIFCVKSPREYMSVRSERSLCCIHLVSIKPCLFSCKERGWSGCGM